MYSLKKRVFAFVGSCVGKSIPHSIQHVGFWMGAWSLNMGTLPANSALIMLLDVWWHKTRSSFKGQKYSGAVLGKTLLLSTFQEDFILFHSWFRVLVMNLESELMCNNIAVKFEKEEFGLLWIKSNWFKVLVISTFFSYCLKRSDFLPGVQKHLF